MNFNTKFNVQYADFQGSWREFGIKVLLDVLKRGGLSLGRGVMGQEMVMKPKVEQKAGLASVGAKLFPLSSGSTS